jgi:hypothetical protein
MDRLGVVAVPGRGWKAFAAPAAFLLAATIAVVVFRSVHHTAPPTPPARGFGLYQSKTPIPPPKRFYRIAAGDTFAAVAAKTGVPLVRIRTLNPSVAPTALFIGEKIRLR